MQRHNQNRTQPVLPPHMRTSVSSLPGSNSRMISSARCTAHDQPTRIVILTEDSTDDRPPSHRNVVDMDPDGTNTTIIGTLPPHMSDSPPFVYSPTASAARILFPRGNPYPDTAVLAWNENANPPPLRSISRQTNSSANSLQPSLCGYTPTPTAWSGHTFGCSDIGDSTTIYQCHQVSPQDIYQSAPRTIPSPARYNAGYASQVQRTPVEIMQPIPEDSSRPQMIREVVVPERVVVDHDGF